VRTLPIMCPNFKAIGLGSSEIWRCKVPEKNTSAGKHKTATALL